MPARIASSNFENLDDGPVFSMACYRLAPPDLLFP